MFEFKLEQVAVAVASSVTADQMMERIGGEWVVDTVTFNELAEGREGRYKLHFNYDMEVEFEILVWQAGPFWLARKHIGFRHPIISHYGTHVDNAVSAAAGAANHYGAEVVQAVETVHHTNPYLQQKGRRYRYAIVDARDLLGADLKFIERIE